MVISFLSVVLSIIFIVLGLIHFNWALGGNWGFEKALPTKVNGKRVLNPKKIHSGLVGMLLTAFALFYVLKSELTTTTLPNWIADFGGWIIPIIFMLRAIGDFKYVGFFKKIKQTDFGRQDTRVFSPLCLLIGIAGIVIQLVD